MTICKNVKINHKTYDSFLILRILGSILANIILLSKNGGFYEIK